MASVKVAWTEASRRQKVVVVGAVVVGLLAISSLGQAGDEQPSASPSAAIAERTPSVTLTPTRVPETTHSPAPSATTVPSPSAPPPPTAIPKPTPVEVTYPDTVAVGGKTVTLKGGKGSYTWADLAFTNALAKFKWTARATSSKCSVSFRWEPSYEDPASKQLTVPRSSTVSKSGEYEAEDQGPFVVTSGCPKWSVALTSYKMPPYWNPWGYNFTPGRRIYSPPYDFCSYFDCIDAFGVSQGYVIQCRDLMFSTAGGRQGACSYHGGSKRTLFKH
jgi:hypothetical protein